MVQISIPRICHLIGASFVVLIFLLVNYTSLFTTVSTGVITFASKAFQCHLLEKIAPCLRGIIVEMVRCQLELHHLEYL